MDYSEADYMAECANMDRDTNPLAVLRACVDAYYNGNECIPGREIEQVLELLEDADNVMKYTPENTMSWAWRTRYAAMKGEK